MRMAPILYEEPDLDIDAFNNVELPNSYRENTKNSTS